MTRPPDVPNRKITLGDLIPELSSVLRDPLRAKENREELSLRRKEESSKKARAEARARKEGRTIRYSAPE